ncbi:MAG: hypothetical protein MZV70_25565 [Desulfobacterales bacterium]|nr:hypothetical protein [Desulfobacterales bacterium]
MQVKARWQDMLVREHDAFFYDLRQRAAKQLYATARKALELIWRMPIWKSGLWMNLSVASKPLMRKKAFRYARPSAAEAIKSSSRALLAFPNPRQAQIEEVAEKADNQWFYDSLYETAGYCVGH